MNCPHCGGTAYGRDKHLNPAPRNGVIFRAHICHGTDCGRTFLSAQLVVTDEFEPVARLDSVLKALMDESDARAQAEEPDATGEERHTNGPAVFLASESDYEGREVE